MQNFINSIVYRTENTNVNQDNYFYTKKTSQETVTNRFTGNSSTNVNSNVEANTENIVKAVIAIGGAIFKAYQQFNEYKKAQALNEKTASTQALLEIEKLNLKSKYLANNIES